MRGDTEATETSSRCSWSPTKKTRLFAPWNVLYTFPDGVAHLTDLFHYDTDVSLNQRVRCTQTDLKKHTESLLKLTTHISCSHLVDYLYAVGCTVRSSLASCRAFFSYPGRTSLKCESLRGFGHFISVKRGVQVCLLFCLLNDCRVADGNDILARVACYSITSLSVCNRAAAIPVQTHILATLACIVNSSSLSET